MQNICVNQQNPREWAEQIVMTPAIYKQALQCFRLPSKTQYEQSQLPNSDQTRLTERNAANEKYELSPLTGSDQIRLIELLPADIAKAPLHCHINVVSLNQSPKFTLIDVNYSMPKRFDHSEAFLYCDGHIMPIQIVFYTALQYLHSSGITTFWIDSVCVNKHDPAD